MRENIEKACHSAGFLLDDLRSALHTATATEALILLPLIERAAVLGRDIEQFRNAITTKGT